MQANRRNEEEAAQASDVEQASGHGGNMRDAGPGVELPQSRPELGSSGHVPLAQELGLNAEAESSGSPGADADRGV